MAHFFADDFAAARQLLVRPEHRHDLAHPAITPSSSDLTPLRLAQTV
jgi:hypothetical protein